MTEGSTEWLDVFSSCQNLPELPSQEVDQIVQIDAFDTTDFIRSFPLTQSGKQLETGERHSGPDL
jgi:hypothetical protein